MGDLDQLKASLDAQTVHPVRGSRRWALLVAAVLAAGLGVSVFGAALLRSSARTHEKQTFNETASDVTATLGTLLRRDGDFLTTLRTVLSFQPQLSTRGFEGWLKGLQGRRRLTGGQGTLVVARVPAGSLAAFLARHRADRAFPALVGGRLVPFAAVGGGPYCLLATGSVRVAFNKTLASWIQGDWCSSGSPIGASQGRLLAAQTDAGTMLLAPAVGQGLHTIVFEEAIYRPQASLATVAQRRAAVIGWVLVSFDIPTIVRQAIGTHRGLAVALYHTNPGQRAVLVHRLGGSARPSLLTHSKKLQIEGEWTVKVLGPPVAGAIPAGVQGTLVLVSGLLVTLLLCALIVVLTRARERALDLVREKTGELSHQALHDALTGLPNRVLALDRARQMLARARRQQLPVAALYVDVDGFKDVNDTFGHAAGDELLQTVAARLMTVVRDGDTAARLGGDEFIVLLEGATLDDGAERVAERLLKVLREPYSINEALERKLTFTASIGIAIGVRDSADELLRDADLALYAAKAAGRDRYVLFETAMQTSSHERLMLEMDLARALELGQLVLHYQPTFDLRSGAVTGVEALIRWRHPTRGMLAPEEFISIAEKLGVVVPIGRWVLNEACRQVMVWREHGYPIDVAVNVSARQLDDDALFDDVASALRRSDLEPAALTLEITETALMRDPEATARRLAVLKALGVRVAIDDFGTGYSSLAYLRQFPVDVLKIDRSFVESVATSKASLALVHTLIQLGGLLEVETLAEGIEDDAQLACLRREGCDHGQGFLFSRPLAATAVGPFLASTDRARRTVVSV